MTMIEDHQYRGRTIRVTDGPLYGIEEGTYVAHGHSGGWTCFYTAEGFFPVGGEGIYPTSSEAVAELHKLVDVDFLEEAAMDWRRKFEPQVVHHVLTQDIAHGGHRIGIPENSLKVNVPLLLVLDLFNAPGINDSLRDMLLKTLQESDIAESLLLESDGLSIRYDEARNVARVHRQKQERRAVEIGRKLQKLASDMQSLLGSAEEERLAEAEFVQSGAPLAARKSASARVLALGAVEPSLLNLLSPLAAATFTREQAVVVGASSATSFAEMHKRAEDAACAPITGQARATESVRGELEVAGNTDAQEEVQFTIPAEPETPLPRHIMFAADAISKNIF